MTVCIVCPFTEGVGFHEHEYTEDWIFGGADGLDPRADKRYRCDTYTYFDAGLNELHMTQHPLCDGEAVYLFKVISAWGAGWNPHYIAVNRGGLVDGTMELLPYTYDKATKVVTRVNKEEESHGTLGSENHSEATSTA